MIQYKLIKEYPGSPELGTIRSSVNNISEWQGTIFYDAHPEYWQRVKEVEYQPKTPLFTTEDGVELFDGYYYYPVEKQFFFLHEKQRDHFCSNEDKFLLFSTKEKAEEYILLNKPCLSLNDLLSVWGDSENIIHFKVSPLFKNFKKLVKSKL